MFDKYAGDHSYFALLYQADMSFKIVNGPRIKLQSADNFLHDDKLFKRVSHFNGIMHSLDIPAAGGGLSMNGKSPDPSGKCKISKYTCSLGVGYVGIWDG